MKILVIDVGGTHGKVLATGHKQRVEFPSGSKMTPAKMIVIVRAATADWKYDVVSIGYPGPVVHGCPIGEPHHQLKSAVQADYVVLGGGNTRLLKTLPPGTRLGDNSNAFRGGYRLWTKLYGGSTHSRFAH